jgi:hypothetical protein
MKGATMLATLQKLGTTWSTGEVLDVDVEAVLRGICHSLDGRQTRITLAAFNLRQMLRRHAHLGRQVLQRQTTLVALAAQEGGDHGFHGESVAQWRANSSYDRVNSYGSAIFFAMPSVR